MIGFPSDIDPTDLDRTSCVICQILTIGQVPHHLRIYRLFACNCGRYWLRRHAELPSWEELDEVEFELWRKDLGRIHPKYDEDLPLEAIG